jgi:hypothetical protein
MLGLAVVPEENVDSTVAALLESHSVGTEAGSHEALKKHAADARGSAP